MNTALEKNLNNKKLKKNMPRLIWFFNQGLLY